MIEEKHLGQIWDNLAFTKLFRSFGMAVGPGKLFIALLAVMLVSIIGFVMDICSSTVIIEQSYNSSRGIITRGSTELDVFVTEPEKVDEFIIANDKFSGQGVFYTLWKFCAAKFNLAIVPLLKLDTSNIFANITNAVRNIGDCAKAFLWAIKYHPLYSAIYFIIAFPVICIAGGAICRCAVLEFARGEKAGLSEAVRFSTKRFKSFLAAPLVPVAIILTIASVIYLLGLLGNIPWAGEIILGIGLPVAFVLGLLAVLMITGAVGGAGMMFPAIAYEGSNGFDSISRSFMYVFSQPLWMIIYSFIATVYGALSYIIVRFFTFLLLLITYTFLELGIFDHAGQASKLERIWSKPEFINLMGSTQLAADRWTESAAGFIINIWIIIVVWVVVAFVVSFYFCANTVIYSLLRNKIDGTGTSEVYLQLNALNEDSIQ